MTLVSLFPVALAGGRQTHQIHGFPSANRKTGVVDSNYTCYNVTTNQEVPQADCGLVATYSPGSTFEQIPNANLNITYADLEYLNGVFGYETLELAGLEITHQQIGVPYRAGWDGTNISSGLMGLAYPAITSEYVGTNVSADNRSDPNSAKEYSPIINTIFFVENLTEPVFSIALCRNPSTFGFGGSLTIGGIPDITDATVNASDVFATVPIEPFALSRTKNFTFYAITVDELVYFEEGYGSYNVQMIVDSGTTFDYFPTEDADAINSLFYPPAQFDEYLGLYVVPCDAIPPEVGVSIGGQTFFHNPDDLIADVGLGDGLCATAISDGGAIAGGDGTYVLGDTFMKNVLAVFDVGKSQMSFSSRMYYEGADDQ